MTPSDVDWPSFFLDVLESVHERFGVILRASQCREGWLQGEFFLAGRRSDLRVNEYSPGGSGKVDLSCGSPPSMLAEIKITGADYKSTMNDDIEKDVTRLRQVDLPAAERYMILIIPNSNARGKLHDFLHACAFSNDCIEREWPEFKARIWQL